MAATEKAGIFKAQPAEKWEWIGNELFDSTGAVLATVRSDVIYVGSERLLVESTPGPMGFRCRATASSGVVYTVAQKGFTVSKMLASCGPRHYILERTSLWRKERAIRGAKGVIATVRPLISGKVEIHDEEHYDDMPFLDAVFLSWACVLIDSPVRRPRY